ncbi:MAG TPA: cation:dicarboxylase symporter family transporter, partial [Gemmatimonadales bacterium]|nr:cation:dicarboxylase symporter family transporter [Gemmatimonadales bacterium]
MFSFLRRINLTGWILIAMAVGITLGWLDHDLWQDTTITPVAQPLATLFLRMIKSIVVPLVFSSLVVGIAGHGDDLKKVGRLALRSLVYFELVTTVALGIGLLAVNVARPGDGVSLQSATAQLGEQFASTHTTLSGVLEHTVPQSFFESAAKNEVLQVVFFAVLFGIALAQVPSGRNKEVMLRFCEGLAEVMFKFTALVMYFAPVGIGAALAVTIGANGLGVLGNLVKLVLTLYGALV